MLLSDLNDSLAFNISRAGLLLRRDLIRTLAEYEVTPEQWQIMRILRQSKSPVNQKIIATLLMKDKHAVSRMVARLERNGWIVKERAKEDARSTLICLTEKGKDMNHNMKEKLAGHVSQTIFSHFTAEEKNQIKTYMKKLRHILGDDVEQGETDE